MFGTSICKVRQVELNQLQHDLRTKQKEVDTCDPQAAQTRRTNEEIQANTAYVQQTQKVKEQALTDFRRLKHMVERLTETAGPMHEYYEKTKQNTTQLAAQRIEYEQDGRTNRRRFVDDSPQEGINWFLQTKDDTVLLAFWITYGIAILIVTLTILQVGKITLSFQHKIALICGILLGCYGIAYYIIVYYG